MNTSNLIFVDVEANSHAPITGQLTEFAFVRYDETVCTQIDTYQKSGSSIHYLLDWYDREVTKKFHGIIVPSEPDPANPALSRRISLPEAYETVARQRVANEALEWLRKHIQGQPIFISDNNGWDFQWIADLFAETHKFNPFGHSSRRITDFACGLKGDFRYPAHHWKKLRRPIPHDHNPVHDSLGNMWAFYRLLRGDKF